MVDLSLFGRDLTELARSGRLDPVVGRTSEVEHLMRVLCRRTKNNPLLLGPPGVGKTALVEGLAQRMAAHDVPLPLRDRTLVELQLGALLAGTQYRGDLEQRLQNFLKRARQGRTVIFIDEIHLLVAAGRGSGMDVANLLKPVLARGDVPCIGASTTSEAEEMFKVDPAMERRFQTVRLAEPSPELVRVILAALRPRLEAHHGLAIADNALDAAVELSLSLASTRTNPDRAIDLLEDACAAVDLEVQKSLGSRPVEFSALRELEAEVARSLQSLQLERHVAAKQALDEFRRVTLQRADAEFRYARRIEAADVTQVAQRADETGQSTRRA